MPSLRQRIWRRHADQSVLQRHGATSVPQGAHCSHRKSATLAAGVTFTGAPAASSREEFERSSPRTPADLFRYANINKDPAQANVLASVDFRPAFGETPATFEISRLLASTIPGANFAIGNGLGVAISIDKTSSGALATAGAAYLRVHGVDLQFNARPRDESVTV